MPGLPAAVFGFGLIYSDQRRPRQKTGNNCLEDHGKSPVAVRVFNNEHAGIKSKFIAVRAASASAKDSDPDAYAAVCLGPPDS